LPRKLGIEATASSLKRLEKIRATLAKRTATEREAAQKQAEALAAVALRFTRKAGESDQLFGSVTSADIAEGLAKQGFQLDKRQIQLAEPIKVVGEYQVTAKVYQEITGSFKVVVEKEA
jgi:large subunit ribosomal protein L9